MTREAAPLHRLQTTDSRDNAGVREPPASLRATFRHIGPGLVLAAGIVGSGELIATTKLGAQAGITLLWLIVLGCLIKVFVQIELARYTVSSGETTLAALNRIPGPRLGANWIVYLWLFLMCATYGLLGGILAGTGQIFALAVPLTGDYAQLIEDGASLSARTVDESAWAVVVAVFTSAVLFFGRYRLLENVSVTLVVMFTVITVGNVIALQTTQYRFSAEEFLNGLSLHIPAATAAANPWVTALAAFGIIGVGATDLIVYPYWCLEKGYARFAGRRTADAAWAQRARGWMRVLKIDALASLALLTLSTVAFYLLGAAVLHRQGLDPDGIRMIHTLSSAYVPVFGVYAKWLFLSGAFAVLYSSFLVSMAGSARIFTDCFRVFGFLGDDARRYDASVALLSLALPLITLAIFLLGVNPVRLILIGGLVAALMLPIIGMSAIYFRYRLTDARLLPGKLWDIGLFTSCLALLVVGVYSVSRIVV
jgi:Mn2+/Fe2+ NRAMP family transporter